MDEKAKPSHKCLNGDQTLQAEDYPSIIELWQKADLPYRHEGRDNKEAICKETKANPGFFPRAFKGHKIIDVAVLLSDLRKSWTNRPPIEPSYRRQGIAKALVDEAEKVLQRRGLRIIGVLIERSNLKSLELLKKLGYKENEDILYLARRESEEV